MDIKVIGTGCDKCDKLYELTLSCLNELQMVADVKKVTDLMEIVRLGVMSSPSLMVDGRLVVSGNVPNEKKLLNIFEQLKLSKKAKQ